MSRAQEKAQHLNWIKAQLINAFGLMKRANNELDMFNVHDRELVTHLRTAKVALELVLQQWNKAVWGKE